MRSDGTSPRRLARGGSPSWGKDSTHVYYHSGVDWAFYSVSIEGGSAEPQRIMACRSAFPSVSPDGQRVAYPENALLKVADLAKQTQLDEWPKPFHS